MFSSLQLFDVSFDRTEDFVDDVFQTGSKSKTAEGPSAVSTPLSKKFNRSGRAP